MPDLAARAAGAHHLFGAKRFLIEGDGVAGTAQDQIRRNGVIAFGDSFYCCGHIGLLRAVLRQANAYTSLTVSVISQSTTAASASACEAPSATARAKTASWRWALVPRARISRAYETSARQSKWRASGSTS